jgi:hypothetical protein
MDWRIDREPSVLIPGRADGARATFGRLYIDGGYFCRTLEDEVREVPFKPVAEWKVFGKTAVPSGMYVVTFEDSPHFGPFTLTVKGVPGYSNVRMHGGTTVDDTDGCVLVGDMANLEEMTIAGAKFHGVLDALKARARAAVARKDVIRLQVRNAPAWYVANGMPVTKAFA